jgi:gliding motility-associated lipoprotein GldD
MTSSLTKNKIYKVVSILISITFLNACSQDYTPKPSGYLRIDFPKKSYHLFTPAGCPFEFEIPDYSNAVADTNGLSKPCWYDINFKQFDGKINLTYIDVKNDLNTHLENCRKLAYKHAIKADGIDEFLIQSDDLKSNGILYSITGNAASSIQFYLTDSTKHFIRGALYFNCPPQSDSLAPVITFCEKDIDHIIKTLKWK